MAFVFRSSSEEEEDEEEELEDDEAEIGSEDVDEVDDEEVDDEDEETETESEDDDDDDEEEYNEDDEELLEEGAEVEGDAEIQKIEVVPDDDDDEEDADDAEDDTDDYDYDDGMEVEVEEDNGDGYDDDNYDDYYETDDDDDDDDGDSESDGDTDDSESASEEEETKFDEDGQCYYDDADGQFGDPFYADHARAAPAEEKETDEFPDPPPFYALFTAEAVEDGSCPCPPPVPNSFTVFGEEFSSREEPEPSLDQRIVDDFYEPIRTMDDLRTELKRINSSILFNILDLVNIFVESSSTLDGIAERESKIEDIRSLFLSFNNLLNVLRPVQVYEDLVSLQKSQIEEHETKLEQVQECLAAAKLTILAANKTVAEKIPVINDCVATDSADSDEDDQRPADLQGKSQRQRRLSRSTVDDENGQPTDTASSHDSDRPSDAADDEVVDADLHALLYWEDPPSPSTSAPQPKDKVPAWPYRYRDKLVRLRNEPKSKLSSPPPPPSEYFNPNGIDETAASSEPGLAAAAATWQPIYRVISDESTPKTPNPRKRSYNEYFDREVFGAYFKKRGVAPDQDKVIDKAMQAVEKAMEVDRAFGFDSDESSASEDHFYHEIPARHLPGGLAETAERESTSSDESEDSFFADDRFYDDAELEHALLYDAEYEAFCSDPVIDPNDAQLEINETLLDEALFSPHPSQEPTSPALSESPSDVRDLSTLPEFSRVVKKLALGEDYVESGNATTDVFWKHVTDSKAGLLHDFDTTLERQLNRLGGGANQPEASLTEDELAVLLADSDRASGSSDSTATVSDSDEEKNDPDSSESSEDPTASADDNDEDSEDKSDKERDESGSELSVDLSNILEVTQNDAKDPEDEEIRFLLKKLAKHIPQEEGPSPLESSSDDLEFEETVEEGEVKLEACDVEEEGSTSGESSEGSTESSNSSADLVDYVLRDIDDDNEDDGDSEADDGTSSGDDAAAEGDNAMIAEVSPATVFDTKQALCVSAEDQSTESSPQDSDFDFAEPEELAESDTGADSDFDSADSDQTELDPSDVERVEVIMDDGFTPKDPLAIIEENVEVVQDETEDHHPSNVLDLAELSSVASSDDDSDLSEDSSKKLQDNAYEDDVEEEENDSSDSKNDSDELESSEKEESTELDDSDVDGADVANEDDLEEGAVVEEGADMELGSDAEEGADAGDSSSVEESLSAEESSSADASSEAEASPETEQSSVDAVGSDGEESGDVEEGLSDADQGSGNSDAEAGSAEEAYDFDDEAYDLEGEGMYDLGEEGDYGPDDDENRYDIDELLDADPNDYEGEPMEMDPIDGEAALQEFYDEGEAGEAEKEKSVEDGEIDSDGNGGAVGQSAPTEGVGAETQPGTVANPTEPSEATTHPPTSQNPPTSTPQ